MSDKTAPVLITGGTGFAGSHLIEALLAAGYTNVHTTVFRDPPSHLTLLLPAENFHPADLTDQDATAKLLKTLQPTQIYHLASFAAVSSSYGGVREVLTNNIGLQVNLLEAVKAHVPQTRVLSIGSADGYGMSESSDELPVSEEHPLRPVNPYSVSKVAQDLLAYSYSVAYKLDIVRARPFNHFGERQSPDFALPAFMTQIAKIEQGEQTELQVGNLTAIRDLTDVKDMVRAYVLLMEKGVSGESYNIGTGVGVQMQTVVDMLAVMATTSIVVTQDPARMRPIDVPELVAANAKIKALGWEPEHSLEESLKRTLDWYREVQHKK